MNKAGLSEFKRSGMHRIMTEHAHVYGAGTFENTEYQELDKFIESIVNMCTEYYGVNATTVRSWCIEGSKYKKDGFSCQKIFASLNEMKERIKTDVWN